MKAREYPTPKELVYGKPFLVSSIKRLKPLFPKTSRLEITYDYNDDGMCDLFIRYQAKPKGRWRTIGNVGDTMTFKYLPDGSGIEFIGWINSFYHDEVDIEDSPVDKLYDDCMT